MKEKTVLSELKKGNRNALKTIYEGYFNPLCLFAIQYTHNSKDAEDLVQGVFLDLWERRKRLVIEHSIKSYLYKATYHAFIDKKRKIKTREKHFDQLKYEAVMAKIEENEDYLEEQIKKLKEKVELLPPRCREILLMSKQQGYKYQEIAVRLNISVKTVESQMRLAFQKIREGFEGDGLYLLMLFSKINPVVFREY